MGRIFAKKRDLRVKPQDIVLVSGWIKTTEWALSAYASEHRSHELSFSIAAGAFTSAECSFSVEKSANVPMSERLGPRPENSEQPPISELRHNQCLFLRYYKCSYRGLGVVQLRHAGLGEKSVMEVDADTCHCAPSLGSWGFKRRSSKGQEKENAQASVALAAQPTLTSVVEAPSNEASNHVLSIESALIYYSIRARS